MPATEIGFHALQNPDGLGLVEPWMSLVVSVDNAGIVEEFLRLNPTGIAIYRMFTPDISVQEGWRDKRDPVEYAQWYVNQFRDQLERNRVILANPRVYIIGGNEPVLKLGNTDDVQGLIWLSKMEAARCRFMHDLGFQCCVFNFPTGFPSVETWSQFGDAYKEFIKYRAIIGIHGYYTQPPEPENAFRVEEIAKRVPKELMFVYTEWGRIDYRDHVSDDQYYNEIVSADQRMRLTGRVLGFALYTLGGTTTWDKYRPTPYLMNKLGNFVKNQTGSIPTQPPVTTPPPVTPPTIPPPVTVGPNLLFNPDLFSEGFAPFPGHDSTNVPKGWTFVAQEGTGLPFPNSPPNTPWGVPSAVYHAVGNGRPGASPLPASEQTLYFNAENPVVYHLYLPFGKQWWKLSQIIKNLPAGKYHFSGEIYPDVYTGAHVWATDPNSLQWEVSANGNITVISKGKGFFGQWNPLDGDYTHLGGDATITLEVVAPFGVEVVGTFLRGFKLFKKVDPMPDNSIVEGIDVSKYQGVIDWPKVAASGVKFAFCRIGDGVTLDPTFVRNYLGAKAAGIVRGSYHYFRASKDAKKQALMILTAVGEIAPGELTVSIDVETKDSQPTSVVFERLKELVALLREALGVDPLIYTSASFWNANVGSPIDLNLWVAHYNASTPTIPVAWKDKGYLFWQYKVTPLGSVPGVPAAIDRDRFNGTLNQFNAYVASLVKPVSTRFKFGDRVKVDVGGLNTRSTPAGTVLGVHTLGATGTIVESPVLRDLGGTMVIWWHINFDTGVDGWCSGGTVGNEKYLASA